MPIIDATTARILIPGCYSDEANPRWMPIDRVEATAANATAILKEIGERGLSMGHLICAAGDSWMDKFTGHCQANLVTQLKLPEKFTAVDISTIGADTLHMVEEGFFGKGTRTRILMDLIPFRAIIFSGGGNDIIRLFIDLYQNQLAYGAEERERRLDSTFNAIIKNISTFIGYRNSSAENPNTPVILHGYDYFQPRPARGFIAGRAFEVIGSWLYQSMSNYGMTSAQMLVAASGVIDLLNTRLRDSFGSLDNVYVIDQRGLLELAQPEDTEDSGDWMDEIHALPKGYETLARQRWNVAIAESIGLRIPEAHIQVR